MGELKDESRGTKDDFWLFARMERASNRRRSPGLLAASNSACSGKNSEKGEEWERWRGREDRGKGIGGRRGERGQRRCKEDRVVEVEVEVGIEGEGEIRQE